MLSVIAEFQGLAPDSRRQRLMQGIEMAVELAAYTATGTDAHRRRKTAQQARIEVAAMRKQLADLDLISSHDALVRSVLDLISELLDRQLRATSESTDGVRPAIAEDPS